MKKRLLSLEDLYTYYLNNNKSTHFSASENDSPIVVQVSGTIKFENDNSSTEGLRPVILQSCHTNLNVNNSNINEDVMQAALPSFSNRPILGYIHKVDQQLEFYSHNMHEDEDGNIVYDEIPVGIIPESCEAKLEYDDDKKKTYVVVKGYIFEEYSHAAEILEREGECAVSVELSIRELSYQAKDHYIDIEDFYFSGVTILGKTENGDEVMPGMVGSNIKLADFSAENNSLFSDKSAQFEKQLIDMQSKLDELITRFNIDENSKKGGNGNLGKFEELLKKYNKTAEDITFDYSKMTDDELEAEFKKLFIDIENGDGDGDGDNGGDSSESGSEQDSDSGVAAVDDTENPDGGEPENPEDSNEGDDGDDEGDGDGEDEGEENTDSSSSDDDEVKKKRLVNSESGNMTISFEISHEDTKYALYNLLIPFEDADNEWYWITNVYDKHFIYENWDGNKIFGQNYVKDGDNISLDCERWNLHKELLTDQEYAELQSMRSNYAELKQFKSDTEFAQLHSKREEILSNDVYSVLSEKETDSEGNESYKNQAYAKLVSEMDNYSLEDLEKELKCVYADYITNGGKFSVTKESGAKKPVVSKKQYCIPSDKKKVSSRYGNLFKNKKINI